MKACELLIIGGGPAGLTAGLYAQRGEIDTILLEKSVMGGQAALSDLIGNYPGIPKISGLEFVENLVSQVMNLGLQVEFEEVFIVEQKGVFFKVKTLEKSYSARAVIITSGARPRGLGLKKEVELLGRGVSYCATCDGPLFKGKKVAIVGGGDSALTEALYLTKMSHTVYIIHRRDEFRGEKFNVKRVMNNPKIKIVWNSLPSKILGVDRVEGVEVENLVTHEFSTLKIDGLFIYVGRDPNTKFVKIVDKDEAGYILINNLMETSRTGVFAAGDCTSPLWRQIAVAVGEGAKAAISATRYLESG